MALSADQLAAKAADKAKRDKAAEDLKAAKAKARADEKQAKADRAAALKASKVETVKQNGISRPNKGKTLRIWEIADEISKATKAPALRKDVTEKAIAEKLELGTIHTQYGRWRKFHGLSSVRTVPTEEKGASSKSAESKPLTAAQKKTKARKDAGK